MTQGMGMGMAYVLDIYGYICAVPARGAWVGAYPPRYEAHTALNLRVALAGFTPPLPTGFMPSGERSDRMQEKDKRGPPQ